MIITYSVSIDPVFNDDLNHFRNIVADILQNINGIQSLYNRQLQFKEVPNNAKINIILVPNEKVLKTCNFNMLSCADRSNGNVYINYTRWTTGSDIFFNGLKNKVNQLWKYRNYLINHEVMHILGFNHPHPNEIFTGNASVMAQQTINLQSGFSYWLPVKSDIKYFKLFH